MRTEVHGGAPAGCMGWNIQYRTLNVKCKSEGALPGYFTLGVGYFAVASRFLIQVKTQHHSKPRLILVYPYMLVAIGEIVPAKSYSE
jgi:hypothetical protein